MSYETALISWLAGDRPTFGPYTLVAERIDDAPLASGTVLHEGPLWSGSTVLSQRDLWWLRTASGEVVACVQACGAKGGLSKLIPLTVRQQEALWSSRLSQARRDPLWRNERVLPSGTVVPEIPLDFVSRREERAERNAVRRESKFALAKIMVPVLNRTLWHTNVGCLPSASEMSETRLLWPEAMRRPAPDASLAVQRLASRVRADPHQAALLDAREAQVARMSEAELARDPHAATILALVSYGSRALARSAATS